MRSVWITILGFMLAALMWVFYAPLTARAQIYAFADVGNDLAEVERSLLTMGLAAQPVLLEGLNHPRPSVRLHCAHVLALQGDRRGDVALLTLLREHAAPEDVMGAQAETYLCNVWARREGPPEAQYAKLSREDSYATDALRLTALNDALAHYPLWAAGFVMRAIVHQRNGSVQEAWRDVLLALELEPANFEAMIVLGYCQILANASEQAYLCYQQAVRLNPRLRRQYKDDILEILKAIEIEKVRQRRERRRELPLV